MRTKIIVDIRKCDNCGKVKAVKDKVRIYHTFNGWVYCRKTNGIGVPVHLDFCSDDCNAEYYERTKE